MLEAAEPVGRGHRRTFDCSGGRGGWSAEVEKHNFGDRQIICDRLQSDFLANVVRAVAKNGAPENANAALNVFECSFYRAAGQTVRKTSSAGIGLQFFGAWRVEKAHRGGCDLGTVGKQKRKHRLGAGEGLSRAQIFDAQKA